MAKTLFGPTALGIDIGDDHLKLSLLNQGLTRKVSLLGLLAQPLEPGVILNGLIQNPEALQQAIIHGLKRFHLTIQDVVASFSVPQEKVYLTTVPTERALSEAEISVIAEEHFPVQAKEAEIRATGLLNDTHQWTVLAAVDKASIQKLIQTCDDIHLSIGAIEFDSLALTRLLRFENSWPDFLLILDIGATHATFTCYHYESGLFSEYNVKSISGDLLTKVMADTMQIPTNQAEDFKRMNGIPMDHGMQNLAMDVLTELNAILKFLATHHHSSVPLDIPIILVGGGAQTIGLIELLSSVCNRPVLTWVPKNRFKLIPKMPRSAYAAFAVSIGTAIRILQYE